MNPRSILVVNAWHDDNRGDSAIVAGTLRLLRQRWPGCRIEVRCLLGETDPAFASAFRHLRAEFSDVTFGGSILPALESGSSPAFRIEGVRWLAGLTARALGLAAGRVDRRTLEALNGFDLVVAAGGSDIFDSGGFFLLGAARLFQVLYPLWVAQALGIPTALLGHTVGPFRRHISGRMVRHVLGRANAVLLREDRSRCELERLGTPMSRVAVAPDLAFYLQPRWTTRVDRLAAEHGLDRKEYAVVVLRRHPYLGPGADVRLVMEMASAVHGALDSGLVRRVAVVVHTVGPTALENDRAISAELAGLADDPRVCLVDADLDPEEAAAFYGGARFLVGVRLHAVILALLSGTPAYAVSYFTAKAPGVMDRLGLGAFVADFETFTAQEFHRVLPALLQSSTGTAPDRGIPALRLELEQAVAAL